MSNPTHGQHEFVAVPDDRKPVYKHGEATSLDRALSKFKRDGVRVLDFWRHRGAWVLKLMVAR